MVELVDTLVLGTSADFRCAGSSPALGIFLITIGMNKGLKTYIRRQYYKVLTIFNKNSGVLRTKRKTPILLSLTSYPPRFKTLSLCIEKLLEQSTKPDKIILWVSYSVRYEDIPKEVSNFQKRGLEIRFCKDIGSYKKNYICS